MLKEMTKTIRSEIAAADIKAKVRMCGRAIQVNVHAYGVEFSEDEQRSIRLAAKRNGLTNVRGMEIDPERMTDPHYMEFWLP